MQRLERDAQLSALSDLLAEVKATGAGRLLLLSDEAGAGKAALVRAFAERSLMPVLSGACEPLFTPRPLCHSSTSCPASR